MSRPVVMFAAAALLLSACDQAAEPPQRQSERALNVPEWTRDDATRIVAARLGRQCRVDPVLLGQAMRDEFVRIGAGEVKDGAQVNVGMIARTPSAACVEVQIDMTLQGRAAYGNDLIGEPKITAYGRPAPQPSPDPVPQVQREPEWMLKPRRDRLSIA